MGDGLSEAQLEDRLTLHALLIHKVLLKIKLVCACKSALRTIGCYTNVREKSLRV